MTLPPAAQQLLEAMLKLPAASVRGIRDELPVRGRPRRGLTGPSASYGADDIADPVGGGEEPGAG